MNKLQKEAIEFFLDKTVKLVQDNNFILTGVIKKLYDDALLFETPQRTALISLSKITEIILLNEVS